MHTHTHTHDNAQNVASQEKKLISFLMQNVLKGKHSVDNQVLLCAPVMILEKK
jgi:hypothetical protein